MTNPQPDPQLAEQPSDPPLDAQLLAERCAEAMLAADLASAWLGIRLLAVGPGRAELGMTVTEQMLNGHRIGHGGFVFSLADSAFAVACNSYNRSTVAAGCDIDFTAPVRGGDELVAVAVERYRRGRSGLYDITVRRTDGTVVAEMRGRAREIPGTLV
ncbi:MAG TPA: hydroxyphenylacetyl-CoA thioesterase PaaI [Jatrophihabitans sp.]|nr:hydroxyphenylacetyl-CoA thioesterase PaaI [Jatrophihabitans sp.]